MMFVPERVDRALYIPPVRWPFLLTAAPAWENVGRRWFQAFSGVVMIEASKQLYQPTQVRKRAVRRPRLIPLPSAQPARVRTDPELRRIGAASDLARLPAPRADRDAVGSLCSVALK